MRNLLLIAKREYLEQIRKRTFLLSTILVPVFIGAIMSFSVFSGKNLMNTSKHVAIATTDQTLAGEIKDQLLENKDEKSHFDAMNAATEADKTELTSKLKAKTIDGFVWIVSENGAVSKAVYESLSSGDMVVPQKVESALNRVLVRRRMAERNISATDADALLKDVSIESEQINEEGKEVKSSFIATFFKGYLMAILLMMTTLQYGMNVARSVIQEKTSRIYEVVLSIAKPTEILSGKLIGCGAVGLTQIGIWAVAGIALAGSGVAAGMMSGTMHLDFSAKELIYFPVYYLLGYLLNSSIFAGLSATCETEQELQMFVPFITVPVALSFALIVAVINNPSGPLSVGISLFPLTAPIIMMFRMGSQMPPDWQFAVSIALMLASIWGALWVSAKLYRVGILMYGKRPTLPEILRWIRYS